MLRTNTLIGTTRLHFRRSMAVPFVAALVMIGPGFWAAMRGRSKPRPGVLKEFCEVVATPIPNASRSVELRFYQTPVADDTWYQ